MANNKSVWKYSNPIRYCIIPARKGSKGVPKKNVRRLGDQPLVSWSIKAALASSCFDKIIVSSDCQQILEVGETLGVEVDARPSSLGEDGIHASQVVIELLSRLNRRETSRPDIVAMLLPTSPFRTAKQIARAAEILDEGDCDSVVGVVRTGKYLNNIRLMRSHLMEAIVSSDQLNLQRQDQDELLFVNGALFMAKFDSLMAKKTFHLFPCAPLEMDEISSLDINTEADFERASSMLEKITL